MIVRSFNPIERGPAVWIDGVIAPGAPASYSRVTQALHEYPHSDGLLDIVINSSGGGCVEGMRIYTALRDIPRRKRVTIYLANSMATVVAMAGDLIRIVERGSMFLHPPGIRRAIVAEMSTDHLTPVHLREAAARLEQTDALHLDIYQRRTGLARTVLQRLQGENTTIGAEEAVKFGFADEIVAEPYPIEGRAA